MNYSLIGKRSQNAQTVKKVPSSRHGARPQGRVHGSALNFVPRDCEAEARPADETAEAQRKRGAACGRNSRAGVGAAVQIYERAATRDGNLANSNQRGRGLNFQAHCMRAGNSGHRNPDGTARIANHNRGYRAQKLASPKACRHGTPERPRRKSGAVFVPGHGPGPGSASARSSRRYAEGCEGEYLICQ